MTLALKSCDGRRRDTTTPAERHRVVGESLLERRALRLGQVDAEQVGGRRRAVPGHELVEQRGEAGVRQRIAELAGLIVERVAQLGPERLVDRHRRELDDVLRLLPTELVMTLRLACDADDRQLAREQAMSLQVVESGQQLAPGQVAGRSEDHDRAWFRRPEGVAGALGFVRGPHSEREPV